MKFSMPRIETSTVLKFFGLLLFLLTVTSFVGVADSRATLPEDSSGAAPAVKMQIYSPAFQDGDEIPRRYTCDGEDISPEIRIANIPEGTRSLALVCDDPDAPSGNWVHWVLYNIPPEMTVIPENILKVVTPILKVKGKEAALMQGKNDFGKYGYGGPCPPKGPAHRYFFRLYALDFMPAFERGETVKGITRKVIMEKIKGHILNETVLLGKYQRQ